MLRYFLPSTADGLLNVWVIRTGYWAHFQLPNWISLFPPTPRDRLMFCPGRSTPGFTSDVSAAAAAGPSKRRIITKYREKEGIVRQ
jgi:hypothetical protein